MEHKGGHWYSTAQAQHCTHSHSHNHAWQNNLLKSGHGTCFNRKSLSHDWVCEDSQLKWVPRPIFGEFFTTSICVSASECNVALGLYRKSMKNTLHVLWYAKRHLSG